MASTRLYSISSADRQAALDDAWEDAADNDGALRASLRNFEKTSRLNIGIKGADGPVLSSSSNGHSSTSMNPSEGAPAPIEMARLWRELIQLHDQAKLWLQTGIIYQNDTPETSFVYYTREGVLTTDVIPTASPTDIQIDAKMRDWLVDITESRGDYSLLGLAGSPIFT